MVAEFLVQMATPLKHNLSGAAATNGNPRSDGRRLPVAFGAPSRPDVRSPLVLDDSFSSSLATESTHKLAKISIASLDISEPSIGSDGCRCMGMSSWAASGTGGLVCISAVWTEVTPLATSW